MYRFWVLLSVLLVMGCGADIDDAEEGVSIDKPSAKTPVITVRKIEERHDEDDPVVEVAYKLVASVASKKDVLVEVKEVERFDRICSPYTVRDLIRIPAGETESATLWTRGGWQSAYGYVTLRLKPFPTVDLVGEGVVPDQEEMQDYWGGRETRDNKTVPEDHVFIYYEVPEEYVYLLYASTDEETTECSTDVILALPDGWE